MSSVEKKPGCCFFCCLPIRIAALPKDADDKTKKVSITAFNLATNNIPPTKAARQASHRHVASTDMISGDDFLKWALNDADVDKYKKDREK